MYLIAILILTACGATVPQPVVEPEKQVVFHVEPAQPEKPQELLRFGNTEQDLTHAVQEARDVVLRTAAVAAEIQARPPVVHDRIVRVPDPVFNRSDRDSLLGRADTQIQRMDEAIRQLRDLAQTVHEVDAQVSGLREFANSPQQFAQAHGPSGIAALLLSLVAYLVGKRRRP